MRTCSVCGAEITRHYTGNKCLECYRVYKRKKQKLYYERHRKEILEKKRARVNTRSEFVEVFGKQTRLLRRNTRPDIEACERAHDYCFSCPYEDCRLS